MQNETPDYRTLLHDFCEAWNRHDRDGLISMVTSDCIFDTASGPSEHGGRHQGTEALKKAFSSVWEQYPDARWSNATHIVVGDRGFSAWTFTGTRAGGQAVRVRGVDIFTFRDGKIAHKDTFRKDRLTA